MFQAENLSYFREGVPIFEDLNLRVAQGKVTAVLGRSGVGKSTLLKLFSGYLLPTQGNVYWGEAVISQATPEILYQFRKRIGVLLQSGALFTDLNVYENVAFPLKIHTTLPESIIRQVVRMKLRAVGLPHAETLEPHELSGGMTKRVALARALSLDPEILFLDEPFAGQDPANVHLLVELIQTVNRALGVTIFLISHDLPETLKVADFVYLLAEGKVVAEGPSSHFLDPKDPVVQKYFLGVPSSSLVVDRGGTKELDDSEDQ